MINWKTTIVGIIAGTLTILQTAVASYQSGAPVQWLQIALGVVFMAFGLVAKSFDVTGIGTTATTDASAALPKLVAASLPAPNVVAGIERQAAIAQATEAVKASLIYPTADNPGGTKSSDPNPTWDKNIDEVFPPGGIKK